MKMIVEEGMGFYSREYKGYKPYQEPERGYDWKDYHKWTNHNELIPDTCHMCDIRKTGCMSPSHPRYFCKRDKKTIQMTLGDF